MRIKRSRLTGLAALGMTVALVAACGGGTGDAPEPADTDAAVETPVPEPDAETTPEDEDAAPVRADADLVIWTDEVKAQSLAAPAQTWGDANGITVAVQGIADARERFITADSLGNGPDIVIGAHDWIGQLVQNASIVPVTIPDTSDFSDTALEAMTFDGQVFGVPYSVETLGLFVNNALTDVPEPASIEEMVAAAEAGGAEHALCLPVGTEGDPYHMQPLFASGGGYIFGRDADGSLNAHDVGVNSDGAVAAAHKLAELGAAGVLSTAMGHEQAIPFFAEGRCAYLISGPWAIAQIEAAGLDYALSAIPGFEGMQAAQPFATVNGFYVAANGMNRAFAEQFLTDLASSTEIVAGMFESNQLPPAQKSLVQHLAAAFPNVARFGELVDNATPMPAIPEMAAVWGPLGQAQAQILDGADPESTIRAAGDQIVSVIGG